MRFQRLRNPQFLAPLGGFKKVLLCSLAVCYRKLIINVVVDYLRHSNVVLRGVIRVAQKTQFYLLLNVRGQLTKQVLSQFIYIFGTNCRCSVRGTRYLSMTVDAVFV